MSNVFKSRFGFHPCDYDTYRKLKAIHKYFWQFLHDYAAWKRWCNKTKHRKGSEPLYCPEFEFRQYNSRGPNSRLKYIMSGYYMFDWSWADDYKNSRTPVTQENLQPLQHSVDEVNQMYLKCRDWYTANKKVA